MPAEDVVSRFLTRVASHKSRLAAVAAAVFAVLLSRRLSSAAMGRALPSGTAKHGIKRFDRLLGNAHLHEELLFYYRGIAHEVVTTACPVVLIDWTQVRGPFVALSATLALEQLGRPITLLCRVHHIKVLGNAATQRRFLNQLSRVLPPGVRPIVVTDAGFHGDFFRDVIRLGWDFVGRIRGTARLLVEGKSTTKKALYRRATAQPLDFAGASLYARNPLKCRLVLVRRRHGKRRSGATKNKEELEYRKQARDPWLLATSLVEHDVERIIELYAMRMQIEESFRDAKNPRFGVGLSDSRCRSAKRLEVQLLLAALATATALLLGRELELRNEHRGFQANTLKRRVLSLVRLGLEWLATRAEELRASAVDLRRWLNPQPPPIRGDP